MCEEKTELELIEFDKWGLRIEPSCMTEPRSYQWLYRGNYHYESGKDYDGSKGEYWDLNDTPLHGRLLLW